MRLAYAFLANAADASNSGKFNVLGGDFDTIRAPAFPAIHATMCVVVGLRGSVDDSYTPEQVQVEILLPSGEQLTEATGAVQVRKSPDSPERRLTAIMQFFGALFPVAGDYAIVVRVDEKEYARLPLRLLLQPNQTLQGAAAESERPEEAKA